MVSTKDEVMFDATTQKNVDAWLQGQYDAKTKETIQKLILERPQEVIDSFYTNLSFGTGGMRGLMGVGTNRMNVYTVRAATQGLTNHLLKEKNGDEQQSVVIGHDSRNNSRLFAEESAKVLAANGIKVYLFAELRPTPLVSFACRYKKCSAAIMITASHNPPAYNGYKVYWSDGGQIIAPHDTTIVDEVGKITDAAMVKTTTLDNPLIESLGQEIDQAYYTAIKELQHYPAENQRFGKDLKVVFANLHGTGITLIPQALETWGFSNLSFVEEQKIPDGNFPTVAYPNPEERSALKLGIDKLISTKGDILIATDPDADRVGTAINCKGEAILLSGSHIACICVHHICEALTNQKRMPEKGIFVKTIVTSELFRAIAESYGKPCCDVLTGFKYISEKIHEWEQQKDSYQFIFGGEESYGYLLGTHSRDKDAIVSSALLCEISLHAKQQRKTLVDLLHDIYRKYGIYRELLISVNYGESKEGHEKMGSAMNELRTSYPAHINNVAVVACEDYLYRTKTWLSSEKKESLTLPKSDVLLFWLADGSKLVVRPSGTEPKIKIYGGAVQKKFEDLQSGIDDCDNRLQQHLQALQKTLLA